MFIAQVGPSSKEQWNEGQDIFNSSTVITKICIFMDTMWPFHVIVDYVSYIVQRLNINPYASTITLLAASNGAIIVNTTNYLSEFYANWNATTHTLFPTGFNLPIILSTARDLTEGVMNADLNTSSLGGQSLIALLMPSSMAYVSDSDYAYCMCFLESLNRTVPDLQFIYFAGGAVVRFQSFVNNPHDDIFPLSMTLSVDEVTDPVVQRIWKVSRRLVNPRCGAQWCATTQGSDQILQYARFGSINFYRMLPNYFFGYMRMSYLKIDAVSPISFTVCTSRSIVLPFRNKTGSQPSAQECSQITGNSFSYDLTDACANYETILLCPPLYVSVQAQSFADASQVYCTDPACQMPNQAQYKIAAYNLNCNGSAPALFHDSLLIILMTFALRIFYFYENKY